MTEETQEIQSETEESQSTAAEPTPDVDQPTTEGQVPSSAVDPTDDSRFGLSLERRHVIAGTLSALGVGAMGVGQAEVPEEPRYGEEVDIEIKTGTVSHDSPGAPEDGTWNTHELDEKSVTFRDPFGSPPVVFIGSKDYTTIGLFRAVDVTETGFESRWQVYRSKSFIAPDAQWVAVGQS